MWEIPVDSEAKPPLEELIAIHDGRCPIDGSKITWTDQIRRALEISRVDRWRSIEAGYYIRDKIRERS